ncbi:MAG: 50S ribosomal protein L11 methyltransferase [Desulfopila sp.]
MTPTAFRQPPRPTDPTDPTATRPAGSALRPDSVLYIYYLTGRIPVGEKIHHRAFIGNWEEDDFSFLFFLAPARAEVDALIGRWPALQLLDTYQMTYEEWQGGAIGVTRIGRFVLKPPWETMPDEPGDLAITLDAGVVFGNGAHPTTRDCLAAMEIACMGGKVHTMIDLGTGTGVLALAAARLDCQACLAVDFNYLAATTATTNVRLNGLEKSILVVNGRAEELLARPADLLVANIHYPVMEMLVNSDGFLQQKWFVLSGLLNSEREKILARLRALPVLLLKQWCAGGVWNTILGITREH